MATNKPDNRSSFGSKRSRNGAAPNDGDWICPECGNRNFGFRTVCNRGKCGTPRPTLAPSAPVTSPYNHPPYYFGAVGGPPPAPPMPFGVLSRYGPTVMHSGMPYDYGVPGSNHGPYGPVPTFQPGSYGGMGYGTGAAISGYGHGFQSPPWAEGSTPDSTSIRKRRGGPDGMSEGDWICPKCENVNYAFRATCNMKKCGAARPSPGPNQPKIGAPEGSWTCSKCDNINYPFRTVCNRKGCGNEKPASDN